MRASRLLFLAAAVLASGAVAAACDTIDSTTDCTDTSSCPPLDGSILDAGDGDNSIVATDGPAAADGPDTAPAGCNLGADPKDAPPCVVEGVGVFVSASGMATAAGSRTAPLLRVSAGIDAAKKANLRRVYICTGTFSEAVVLDAAHDGISLFGGFSCNGWSWTGATTTLGAGATGLTVTGTSAAITVEDLTIVSDDQTQVPGGSSIAAFVANAANVTFSRDVLQAGKGGDGAPGVLTNASEPSSASLVGHDGSGGQGGASVMVNCAAGGMTIGGQGGANGFGGDAGVPALGGGTGGVAGACSPGAGQGGDGHDSTPSTDGAGATNAGALSETGWIASTATPGTAGTPGQGGGGGYGSGGGGGGGGGAGGCGGAGGGAGGSGGSSIALATYKSTVSVTSSTLTAGAGGGGGAGTAGQSGQSPGGVGGTRQSGTTACNGGNGGAGAAGAAGGGGAGGDSIAVAYVDPMPSLDTMSLGAATFATMSAKGTGGAPGSNDGVVGVSAATKGF